LCEEVGGIFKEKFIDGVLAREMLDNGIIVRILKIYNSLFSK